jgi:hypothetical protein
MLNFIARVELHSASYADYENLHSYMQQNRYSRVIKGDNGNTYQLPTGTYVSVGNFSSADNALQAAITAANATGRQSSVIVADWNTTKWQGLPLVNAARSA